MRSSFGRLLGALVLLSSCSFASQDDRVAIACKVLVEKRTAYESLCEGWSAPVDPRAAIDTCIGIVTAPGSLLTVAEVDACSAEIARGCGLHACLGHGGDLLYPSHEKKGGHAPGVACFAQVQCESGFCSSLGTGCGHCLQPRAPGESCSGPFDACEPPWVICTGAVCVPPGDKLGEPCNRHVNNCQLDLFCKQQPAGTPGFGFCAKPGYLGEPCIGAYIDECAFPLVCAAGVCAPAPPSALLADGAACTLARECEHFCVHGLCAAQPAPATKPNDDCSYTGRCGPGLRCETGVCAAQLSLGAACQGKPDECGPGLQCASNCGAGADAASQPSCNDTRCAPLPKIGEPCTDSGACAPGAICQVNNPLARGLCLKSGTEGDACPCGPDLGCVSGRCVAYGAAACR